jgi:hypothetical protein
MMHRVVPQYIDGLESGMDIVSLQDISLVLTKRRTRSGSYPSTLSCASAQASALSSSPAIVSRVVQHFTSKDAGWYADYSTMCEQRGDWYCEVLSWCGLVASPQTGRSFQPLGFRRSC